MFRRGLTWALTLPLVGTSVLAGHAIAYRAMGEAPDEIHGYLAHAPHVLALVLLGGLVAVAVQQRTAPRFTALPFLAPAVFTAQEHLERFLHTGDAPVLVGDRTFLLGLALQVPIAVLLMAASRRVVRVVAALGRWRVRPPRLALLPATLASAPGHLPGSRAELPGRPVRGPPFAVIAAR